MAVKIIQLKDMDGNVLLPQGYSASHDNDGNLFSDIYATIQLVNTKANNNEVVHLLTDETVTGLKTLNTSGEIALILKSSTIDSTTTPSATQYGNFIDSRDKNGTRIARIFTSRNTAGNNTMAIQAWNGSTNYAITVDSAGNTTAPTPSSNTDNSTKIATTAWVTSHNTVDTSLVHRSGNETIAGVKTFTNTGAPITFKNNNVEQLTIPSAYSEQMVYCVDKNNKRIACYGGALTADAASRSYIAASKYINDAYVYSVVEAYIDTSGNCWACAPTPTTTDNNTKIATTAFVYNRQHRLCTSGGTQTTLWEGSLGSGNITLNQSYKNFDYICVVMQNDSSANTFTHLVPVWEIDLRRSYGTSWFLINGTNYWAMTAASTETSWISNGENSVMRKIIGIKY